MVLLWCCYGVVGGDFGKITVSIPQLHCKKNRNCFHWKPSLFMNVLIDSSKAAYVDLKPSFNPCHLVLPCFTQDTLSLFYRVLLSNPDQPTLTDWYRVLPSFYCYNGFIRLETSIPWMPRIPEILVDRYQAHCAADQSLPRHFPDRFLVARVIEGEEGRLG